MNGHGWEVGGKRGRDFNCSIKDNVGVEKRRRGRDARWVFGKRVAEK